MAFWNSVSYWALVELKTMLPTIPVLGFDPQLTALPSPRRSTVILPPPAEKPPPFQIRHCEPLVSPWNSSAYVVALLLCNTPPLSFRKLLERQAYASIRLDAPAVIVVYPLLPLESP